MKDFNAEPSWFKQETGLAVLDYNIKTKKQTNKKIQPTPCADVLAD